MVLHGEMVIELTDENSGTVETIRESNMVTNAVNHLLGLNPLGIFYKASGQYDDMVMWNDYLLPYLVLDINEYRTIPIHIQYLKGSYGTVDLGATMALILLSISPVIIFYLTCQKYIIKGVAAGAVKG